MKPTPYDTLRDDPANWRMGMISDCPEDPRVIVPKRPSRTGRTLNFAHAVAWWVLTGTVLVLTTAAPPLTMTPITTGLPLFLVLVAAITVFYYRNDLRRKSQKGPIRNRRPGDT